MLQSLQTIESQKRMYTTSLYLESSALTFRFFPPRIDPNMTRSSLCLLMKQYVFYTLSIYRYLLIQFDSYMHYIYICIYIYVYIYIYTYIYMYVFTMYIPRWWHLSSLRFAAFPTKHAAFTRKIGADSLLFAVLDGHGGTRLREPQWPRHAAGIHNGNDNVNMIYIYIYVCISYTHIITCNYIELYVHISIVPQDMYYIYIHTMVSKWGITHLKRHIYRVLATKPAGFRVEVPSTGVIPSFFMQSPSSYLWGTCLAESSYEFITFYNPWPCAFTGCGFQGREVSDVASKLLVREIEAKDVFESGTSPFVKINDLGTGTCFSVSHEHIYQHNVYNCIYVHTYIYIFTYTYTHIYIHIHINK